MYACAHVRVVSRALVCYYFKVQDGGALGDWWVGWLTTYMMYMRTAVGPHINLQLRHSNVAVGDSENVLGSRTASCTGD